MNYRIIPFLVFILSLVLNNCNNSTKETTTSNTDGNINKLINSNKYKPVQNMNLSELKKEGKKLYLIPREDRSSEQEDRLNEIYLELKNKHKVEMKKLRRDILLTDDDRITRKVPVYEIKFYPIK